MKEFDRLMEVMRRVKAECPWDRKQTHETLRQYFIEETFEVIDAIDEGDDEGMKEELGDVQIQILFHALLGEERGKFTIEDVFNAVSDKLINRHPHVFGDTKVNGSAEVLQNWEHIKLKEGKKKSILDGVPKEVPALIKAYRTQSKASRVGFDWTRAEDVLGKVTEEVGEFQEAVQTGGKDEIENELGDLLFSIVNLARKLDVNPEDALRRTVRKFTTRFKYIEQRYRENETDIHNATLEEMDKLWEEAKIKTGV